MRMRCAMCLVVMLGLALSACHDPAKVKIIEDAAADRSPFTGKPAAPFELLNANDEKVSLASLQGKWFVLYFYPKDDTPGCTAQLQDVQDHVEQLRALKCHVYGVNPAECESHAAFAEKHGFTFPLLTDRGASVSRQFRCTVPFPMRRVLRSVYLVNPERKIRLANRGAPSVEAIVRSIQALQQATKDGM